MMSEIASLSFQMPRLVSPTTVGERRTVKAQFRTTCTLAICEGLKGHCSSRMEAREGGRAEVLTLSNSQNFRWQAILFCCSPTYVFNDPFRASVAHRLSHFGIVQDPFGNERTWRPSDCGHPDVRIIVEM